MTDEMKGWIAVVGIVSLLLGVGLGAIFWEIGDGNSHDPSTADQAVRVCGKGNVRSVSDYGSFYCNDPALQETLER